MYCLDQTFDTLAENLACDEALLDEADASATLREWWRLWESPQYAVVIGRSSKVGEEVDLEFCRQRGIPVARRCSGGASVVIGPGCLMFTAVLSYPLRPELHLIDQAHRLVLGQIAAAVGTLGIAIEHQGISDLTLDGRKVSGNSLRCKRQAVLYHGTLLYDFPLDLLAQSLRLAPRQPAYRAGRGHREFVANLPVSGEALRRALVQAWPNLQRVSEFPAVETNRLATDRYGRDDWNFRLP